MKSVEPIREKEKIIEFNLKMQELGKREHILFLILLYTGLRISDILNLKVNNFNKDYLELKEEKTGKEMKRYLNKNLKRELKIYLDSMGNEDYIFKSRKGNKPITRQRAWQLMKKIEKELGMVDIGCHTFRKTFGYHYYQKSKDIITLQKLFNHTSPTTTIVYIGIEQNELDNAVRNMDFGF